MNGDSMGRGPDRETLLRMIDFPGGPVGFVGEPYLDDWAGILSATASQVHLFGSSTKTRDEELVVEVTTGVLESAEIDLATLIALEWPDAQEPLRSLELLFARMPDEGMVHLALDVDAKLEARLLRASESLLRDVHSRKIGENRIELTGRRRAPGRELSLPEVEPIDVTALLYCRGHNDRANASALDLLFRQNFPPSLVLVIDDAAEGEAALPEDLFGMAAWAASQPALMKGEGQGRAQAWDLAREHIDTTACVWIEAGDRLAPNHLGALLSVLAADEEPDLAIAAGFALDASGTPQFRAADDTSAMPPCAAMFVPDLLDELEPGEADFDTAFQRGLGLADGCGWAPWPLYRNGPGLGDA